MFDSRYSEGFLIVSSLYLSNNLVAHLTGLLLFSLKNVSTGLLSVTIWKVKLYSFTDLPNDSRKGRWVRFESSVYSLLVWNEITLLIPLINFRTVALWPQEPLFVSPGVCDYQI